MRTLPQIAAVAILASSAQALFLNPVLAADTVTIQSLKRVEIDEKKNVKKKGFFMETFYYEDFIYSRGKKTELGDQVEISASLRYQLSDDTFFRARFETFPEDNRYDNKTSQFELLAGHKYGVVDFTVDLQVDTDESSSGGTSLGLDLDSEFTRINWLVSDKLKLAFYPFNFDGEVGVEFNTWDVTRIYFIDGAPTTVIAGAKQDGVGVIEKTIPGLELTLGDDRFNIYAGAGLATYLHSTNPDYDIQNNQNAQRWERRTTFGYKFGLNFRSEKARVWLGAVGQTEAEETGSLIEHAASAYGIFRLGQGLIIEGEIVGTKAGEKPWRLDRSRTWFEQTTTPGFYPIYTDYNGTPQNWLGETDIGASMRLGLELKDDLIPYLALRYQGKNFIHRDETSAHILRTADESLSHGGLKQAAIGSFLHYGNFVVNPEFEYRQAKNPVFTNAGDAFFENNNLSQRLLANFTKTDYILKIFVTYSFDGAKPFTP